MEPLVSIIIPIYKVEKYLDKCIESVVNQTYANLEIILVDDGSPDNCPAICDEWAKKDSRIMVIHKENGGLSSARNSGVAIAKGEWIGFIDSDDYIVPDMYEKMFLAVQESEAELCICGMKWVNEDGSKYENVLTSPIINEVLTKEVAFSKLVGLDYYYYVTSVNKLYKKELFEKVIFPEGKLHEDEFTAHLFFNECEKIVCVQDELYFYVQHQNSIMNAAYSIKRLDAVYAIYDRYLFFRSKGDKKKAKITARQVYGALIFNISQADMIKNKKELFPLVIKCVFALFPDLRIIKLVLVYGKRWFQCLLDV